GPVDPAELSPESAGPLPEAGPADLGGIERVLGHFLGQLAVCPDEGNGWTTRLGALPWALLGLAAVGTTHELARGWQRRRGTRGPAGLDDETLTWLRGPAGLH